MDEHSGGPGSHLTREPVERRMRGNALGVRTGMPVYFCNPHSPWQRGSNENTNGLVRQYFPKKHDFTTVTEAEVERVTERLNNRPRKTLGFRTPNEVFFKQRPVALQT